MVRVATAARTSVVLADRGSGREWTVTVPPFELAATATTRGQWAAVSGGTPSPTAARLPVVEVSWREAVTFCNRLSVRAGLTPVYDVRVGEVPQPGRWRPHDRPAPDEWVVTRRPEADGYRLPTEAEWQLACRAGTTGPHYGALEDIAWYAANSGGRLPAVGLRQPNAWGLYDMLGCVWEWCWDLFDEEVYGAYRVIRGGGWADPPWSCRAGVRRKTSPTARLDDLGFRVARSVTPSSASSR